MQTQFSPKVLLKYKWKPKQIEIETKNHGKHKDNKYRWIDKS